MNRPSSSRGFVLLVVLAAAAVLSLIAAFIYSRTEDQLMLSITTRGQSLAAARATLAAERKLAIYRANYPITALNALNPVASYAVALTLPQQVGDREFANYDKATYPGLEVSNGGGAQWCVQTWKMDRGTGIAPWTVIEAFGFYGYTVQVAGQDFVDCTPQGNPQITWSHVTVFLETPASSSGPCVDCGGGLGTGTVGGS
jgi:hypothetical protein